MEKQPDHRQQEAKRRKVHRRQKTQRIFQKVSQISFIYFASFFHNFLNKNNFLKYYFESFFWGGIKGWKPPSNGLFLKTLHI